ncbi:hypothetical protein TRFO_10849 [Tritrichomonas foetus]|uniref:USP domain-containing protein n=1 Tax=Tritrichomonas foetus TaxID=1144522 RepID=A0A1J4J6N9_9EUKA|nr:hypothetical protein TRFO_10849 [Tritrichomonas foetus]|eukprot:OHS94902.1 hypothetical protein TRFO_10849 [Tritrichomonas foetus]
MENSQPNLSPEQIPANKEDGKMQNSHIECWNIRDWRNVSEGCRIILKFNFFPDVFNVTLEHEDDNTFVMFFYIDTLKVTKQFEIILSAENTDPRKTSPHLHNTLTFTSENPKQEIKLPNDFFDQLTEENGFISSNGDLLLKIEIIEMKSTSTESPKPPASPLTIPIPQISASNNPIINRPIFEPAPYAGLKNQGSTCYMNSILQSLYFIPEFRSIIYQMEIPNNVSDTENIPLNLQRLFGMMQLTKGPVSTNGLTKSFGWDNHQVFMQNDAQEFCRMFLDNLEMKMKGTSLQNAIPSLFSGNYIKYIRCRSVDYQNNKKEEIYDILLDVKGVNSLSESFEKYIETEPLIGDNQYDAGPEYGKQDADMGVEFSEFPRVLFLHLSRFQYDPYSNHYIKLNTYFSFPEIIDLAPYSIDKETPNNYELFGVLVHWGTIIGGHYFAYLRTTRENRWFEFNDAKVTEVTAETAIEGSFGGVANKESTSERLYSAYMLIYIKQSCLDEVFRKVENDEIPDYIYDYIKVKEEEEKILAQQQFEKDNTVNVSLINEQAIEYYAQNNEIKIDIPLTYFDSDDHGLTLNLQLKKYDKLSTVYEKAEKVLNRPKDRFDLFTLYDGHIHYHIPRNSEGLFGAIQPLPRGLYMREINDEEFYERSDIECDTETESESQNQTNTENDENEHNNNENDENLHANPIHNENEIGNSNNNNSINKTSSLTKKYLEDTHIPSEIYLVFVLSYIREMKRAPLHFAFTKRMYYGDDIYSIFDDYRKFYNLPNDCELSAYYSSKPTKLLKFDVYQQNLSELINRRNGVFLIIQLRDGYLSKYGINLTFKDMTGQSFFDEEEEDEEAISYVSNFLNENPKHASDYLAFIYQTVQIKVSSPNAEKLITIPFRVSFHQLKLFAANVLQIQYDSKYDTMLVFPNSDPNFINTEGNDQEITVEEAIQNFLPNNRSDKKLHLLCLVYPNISYDCFNDTLMTRITDGISQNCQNTKDSHGRQQLENIIYQLFPRGMNCCEIICCLNENLEISEPLRIVANNDKFAIIVNDFIPVDEMVKWKLRIEIVPQDQRIIESNQFLLSVRQVMINTIAYYVEKKFIYQNDGDPYIFKFYADEIFAEAKERIFEYRKISPDVRKKVNFWLQSPSAEEGNHLMLDEEILSNLLLPGCFLVFGPTNLLQDTPNVYSNFQFKQQALKIFN